MTLRQFFNVYLLKRNWNPINANYTRNFRTAIQFTKSLGLDCPNFNPVTDMSFTEVEKEELINSILHEVYINSGLQIEDVALKCFWMSNLLHKFLKERFNLDSVVTSGYVYGNNLQLYYEPKKLIRRRLEDSTFNAPVKFHTWVTLTNYVVIDLTLAPSMWLEQVQAGYAASPDNSKKIMWLDPKIADTSKFFYQPIFIGYDYFTKINVVPKLEFVFQTRE